MFFINIPVAHVEFIVLRWTASTLIRQYVAVLRKGCCIYCAIS